MGKLDAKVAVVTGASRGIGNGIARGLAVEGALVVIDNRRPEAGEQAVKEFAASGLNVVSIPTMSRLRPKCWRCSRQSWSGSGESTSW